MARSIRAMGAGYFFSTPYFTRRAAPSTMSPTFAR